MQLKASGLRPEAPGCRKTMLQKKDNRAAGELEGAKAPLVIGLIAIKNVRYGLFDERSEIFRENFFHKKCGVF